MVDQVQVPVFPAPREVTWALLGERVRHAACRRVADVEGLDGLAAAVAVVHGLRVPGSSWGPVVDEAVQHAVRVEVVEPLAAAWRPMMEQLGQVMRAVGAVLAPLVEAVREAAAGERELAGGRFGGGSGVTGGGPGLAGVGPVGRAVDDGEDVDDVDGERRG